VLRPKNRALAHSVGRVDGVVARLDNRRMLHAVILADPLVPHTLATTRAKQFNDGNDTLLWIRFMSARAAIEFVSRLDTESRKAKVLRVPV
jgi:hypothetical protein